MAKINPHLEDQISAKLREGLQPVRLALVNESYMHSVPAGSQTHWNLIIVAQAFYGLSLVERQRLVYQTLSAELQSGVHALTMKTLTPEEWDGAGGEVTNPAPLCRGGSKH